MVLPGFLKPEMSLFYIEGGVPPFTADAYVFEFAVNLLTLNYLQTTNVLKAHERDETIEFLQTSESTSLSVSQAA